MYNTTQNTYKGLSQSSGITFVSGNSYEYSLVNRSSRAKSITIKGIQKDNVFELTYDPQTEIVSVCFGE